MPCSLQDHPSAERLQAFAVGLASDEDLELISGHLDICPDCCRCVQQASVRDPLTRRLLAALRLPPASLDPPP